MTAFVTPKSKKVKNRFFKMNQAQLIRSIEQQLENLMLFDEDLAYEYECDLYYDCNEDEEPQPIVENFTLKLLTELEKVVNEYDND